MRRLGDRARTGRLALPAWLLTATCLTTLLPACSNASESPPRPDVILIVVDTLRADVVLDPLNLVDTPHIDALAADGVVFPHAFAHAPMTLPAHTSLFSSQPPFQTGVLNNGQEVPESLPLLAPWLAEYGYETRAVISLGTLHLGRRSGVKRGFDAYDVDFWRMDKAPSVVRRLGKHLEERDPESPLFLFAHFSDPHEPYNERGAEPKHVTVSFGGEELDRVTTSEMTQLVREVRLAPGRNVVEVEGKEIFRVRLVDARVGDEWIDPVWEEGEQLANVTRARVVIENEAKEEVTCRLRVWVSDVPNWPESRARYLREVEFVDGYVGEFLDALRAEGLYDDAIIVFTSDHGESLGEHHHLGHVEGLDDNQIGVPLIVKLPAGHAARGDLSRARERIVPHLDVVPTLLDLVGLPPLPRAQGASLLSASEDRVHVAQTHKPEARQDRVALRDARYKMTYVKDEDRFEMFDLVEDERELTNVFETHAHLRPEWPERLKSIASIAERQTRQDGDLDEETRRALRSLGYGG